MWPHQNFHCFVHLSGNHFIVRAGNASIHWWGLFDYLADLFKIDNSHGGRFKTVLLTFLPPALLYLIFPNGFIYGIGGAGLCATIWAVIIPAVLAIKARKKFPNQMFTVWGGNLTASPLHGVSSLGLKIMVLPASNAGTICPFGK